MSLLYSPFCIPRMPIQLSLTLLEEYINILLVNRVQHVIQKHFIFIFFFILQTFNAARASFLPENEKQELIDQLKIVHGIY